MSSSVAPPAILFVGSDEELASHAAVMDNLGRFGLRRSLLRRESLKSSDFGSELAGVHAVVFLASKNSERVITEFLDLKERIPDRPVIVVTSRGVAEGGVLLVKAGAYEAIVEPCAAADIAKSVLKAVQHARQGSLNREWSRFISSERIEMSFKSRDIGFCKVPLDIADRLFEAGLLDSSGKLRLTVAFQEAVVNAHDHGNLELDSSWREDVDLEGIDAFTRIKIERLTNPSFAEREIWVSLTFDGQELRITITDEGSGCPKSVREAPLPESPLELSSGRGIFLMRWGADQVLFNDIGNQVTLIKRVNRTSEQRLWQ